MNPIAFSGNPLDRASYSRTDPAWLAAQRAAGLFLPFWQNRPFVAGGRAGFLPGRAEWQDCLCVFLGLDGTQPLFAVDLPGDTEPVLDRWQLSGDAAGRLCTAGARHRHRGPGQGAASTGIGAMASVPIAVMPRNSPMAATGAPVRNAAPSIFPAPIRW